MDSLSFRNQQLAKRVELLQEELAVSEAKGKKGKVIMKVDQGRGRSWGHAADGSVCSFCAMVIGLTEEQWQKVAESISCVESNAFIFVCKSILVKQRDES